MRLTQNGLSLVTGATGFVGSAVARALLARGHAVRVMSRPSSDLRNLAGLEVERVSGDLTDPASLARAAAGCRTVFHVAADYRIWVPDPAAMLRTNVDGTVAMLRAAQAAGAERIVYCSSVAALGLTADGTPADETTPVFVGTQLRGLAGAFAAFAGLIALPVVVLLGLGAWYFHARGGAIDAWTGKALAGVAAAATGLVLANAIRLARANARSPPALAIIAATALAIGVGRFNLLLVLALALPLSLYLARAEPRR